MSINNIMEFFPLEKPRSTQERVINAINKAFDSKRIVILEAPVGSGKSAIAMTFARAINDAHIITPRKSLQDQYLEDFREDVVLMKGRNAYPCTMESTPTTRRKVLSTIMAGGYIPVHKDEVSCSDAPCRNSLSVLNLCVATNGRCPYDAAMTVAQESPIVVHNIHSFIFQTNFGERFERRGVMIIDEAHEVENAIRGFISKKISTKAVIDVKPELGTIDQWCTLFSGPDHMPEESAFEKQMKATDESYLSERDKHIVKVQSLRESSEYYKQGFSTKMSPIFSGRTRIGTTIEFIPHSLGGSVHRYLLDYGEKVLLMSGTIYDHNQYCRSIGVNPDEAISIKISSSFPRENRPVYLKQDYQVDTSFANYQSNFSEMIGIIDKVQNIFKDAKGLIHAPSYDAAAEIVRCTPGRRLMTHGKADLASSLQLFYESDQPLIFVSPVCQQGVDFKDDRARFQIIVRVPYLNTADEFVNDKVKTDFNWYNYQALVTFGQMLGRPVRSETDFGATFLLDARFNKFVRSNSGRLPKWVQESFIYK